jgi:hypothetical protein
MPQLVVIIEIGSGLIGYDFDSPERKPGTSAQASIDSARTARLPPGRAVQIPLRLRGARRTRADRGAIVCREAADHLYR